MPESGKPFFFLSFLFKQAATGSRLLAFFGKEGSHTRRRPENRAVSVNHTRFSHSHVFIGFYRFSYFSYYLLLF